MEQEGEERIQNRPQHQARDERAPQHRSRREKPADQEEGYDRWWHQTAAQIVEDLPAVENGKRIGFNPTVAQRARKT